MEIKRFYGRWMKPLGYLLEVVSALGFVINNIHQVILHEPHDVAFNLSNAAIFIIGTLMVWVGDSLRHLELRIEELEKRSQL